MSQTTGACVLSLPASGLHLIFSVSMYQELKRRVNGSDNARVVVVDNGFNIKADEYFIQFALLATDGNSIPGSRPIREYKHRGGGMSVSWVNDKVVDDAIVKLWPTTMPRFAPLKAQLAIGDLTIVNFERYIKTHGKAAGVAIGTHVSKVISFTVTFKADAVKQARAIKRLRGGKIVNHKVVYDNRALSRQGFSPASTPAPIPAPTAAPMPPIVKRVKLPDSNLGSLLSPHVKVEQAPEPKMTIQPPPGLEPNAMIEVAIATPEGDGVLRFTRAEYMAFMLGMRVNRA